MIESQIHYRKKKNYIGYFLLLFITVSIYIFTVNTAGDNLDFYGAVIYYINWIDEIAKLKFDQFTFIETYNISNNEILAPEPIPGVLIYLITRFIKSPTLVLDFLNLTVLMFFVHFIIKAYKEKIIFILLFLAITTGYYEFVLLHMTHRFKIAFLFFMISIYFVNKKNKISEIFYVLVLFSHFSMFTILPLSFFMRHLGFNILPNLSIKKLLIISVLGLILYSYGNSLVNQEYFALIWESKFNQLSLGENILLTIKIYIPIIIISLILIYILSIKIIKYLTKHNILGVYFWLSTLLLYLILTLSLIGTSRLLMVYYLWFLIVILSNWSFIEYKKKVKVTILFAPIFLYSLVNGFIKGPISILYNL